MSTDIQTYLHIHTYMCTFIHTVYILYTSFHLEKLIHTYKHIRTDVISMYIYVIRSVQCTIVHIHICTKTSICAIVHMEEYRKI